MKRNLLSWASTLMLLLVGLTQVVQAQGNSDKNGIKKTGDGFDIYYQGISRNVTVPGTQLSEGFVSLKFKIQALRNQNIEDVFFELPANGGIISPVGFYNSISGNGKGNGQGIPSKRYRVVALNDKDLMPTGFKQQVEQAVRFEAIGGKKSKSKKKADIQIFEFILSEAEYAAMTDLHVAVESSEEGIGTKPDVRSIGYTSFSKSERDNYDNENGKGNGKLNTTNKKTITPLACTAPSISGNSDPCPGSPETYAIPVKAGSNIKSITWQIPTTGSDGQPSNWELLSTSSVSTPYGPVTNEIKVKVGDISGTIYATVDMGSCGTQVVSFATYLGDEIPVTISTVNGDADGNDQEVFEEGDLMIFNANANQSRDKREYVYNWAVPVGWTIFSGQGTSQLIVIAGSDEGFVEVDVKSKSMDAVYCGLGYAYVELIQENGTCTGPGFDADGPTEVCASSDKIYTFSVNNVDKTGKTQYEFFLPDAMEMVAEGYGYVSVKIVDGTVSAGDSLYVTVVAVKENTCGATSECLGMIVVDCPTESCTPPVTPTIAQQSEICNLADEGTTIRVSNPQAGVTYDFILPDGFAAIDQGDDYVTVVTFLEEEQLGPQTITLIATNDCSSTMNEQTVTVVNCGNGNPLPVTLTSFNGASRNGSVELAWSTASEINNDRFEIERSANGKEFKKVGEVKGNGNSTVLVDYTYTDRSAASGTVYYRLKQIDFDGKSEYSKVIAVSHTGSAGSTAMSVYPNPVTDGKVSLRFQQQVDGNATIRLTDMSGRVLYSQEAAKVSAEHDLNLTGLNLKAGIYMISVTANGQSTTQRIMVR